MGYASAMNGQEKLILVDPSLKLLTLAKAFVRKLLAKDAGTRPTATQALSHPFIAYHTPELMRLYDEMVMSSWTGRDTREAKVLSPLGRNMDVFCDDTVQKTVETAFTEIQGNIPETKERNRLPIEGKENGSQLIEKGHDRKRRRIVQECFVLC